MDNIQLNEKSMHKKIVKNKLLVSRKTYNISVSLRQKATAHINMAHKCMIDPKKGSYLLT